MASAPAHPFLHTATAFTVRAAVKVVLIRYDTTGQDTTRHDTTQHDRDVVIFFAVKKNKGNIKAALAASNTQLEISGFNLTKNNIFCLK